MLKSLAQLKNIYSDLVKGYEILSEGYNAVKDISQGNFDLHKHVSRCLDESEPCCAEISEGC